MTTECCFQINNNNKFHFMGFSLFGFFAYWNNCWQGGDLKRKDNERWKNSQSAQIGSKRRKSRKLTTIQSFGGEIINLKHTRKVFCEVTLTCYVLLCCSDIALQWRCFAVRTWVTQLVCHFALDLHTAISTIATHEQQNRRCTSAALLQWDVILT